jgi:hypothetical protein
MAKMAKMANISPSMGGVQVRKKGMQVWGTTERSMHDDLDDEIMKCDGKEVHAAWFVPRRWPGRGNVIGLLLPECEMQAIYPREDAPAPIPVWGSKIGSNR